MKVCYTCELELDLSQFWTNGPGLYRASCKTCSGKTRKKSKDIYHVVDTTLIEKQCTGCKETKSISLFTFNKTVVGGYSLYCTNCWKIKNTKNYKRNPDKIKQQTALWAKQNKEKVNASRNKRQKERMVEEPLYVLIRRLRNRLYYALKNKTFRKNNTKTFEHIGCSPEFLKQYIESKFEPWMSWEKQKEIDIDHIIPLSSAKNEVELYKLQHYTNLQPMCRIKNRKKGSKMSA